VVEGVSAVNLSQCHMVVVVLAVLLFVVAGLVVSATQRASTQLDQTVAVLPGLAAAGVAALAIVTSDRRQRAARA
jgi:hypothetical protein